MKATVPSLLLLLFLAFNHSTTFAQGQFNPGGGHQPPNFQQGEDLNTLVKKLADAENQEKTSASNVQERYQMLNQCMRALLSSGHHPDSILTRNEAMQLNTAVQSQDKSEAVRIISEKIEKLSEAYGSADSSNLNTTPDNNYETPSRPDSNNNDNRPPSRPSQRPQRPPQNGPGRTRPTSPSLEKWSLFNELYNHSHKNVLKLCNPVIDTKERKLYICGTKSTYLAIVDIDTEKIIETIDIKAPGGFIIPDFTNKKLYIFDFDSIFQELDLRTRQTKFLSGLPNHIKLPKKGEPLYYNNLEYTGSGYPFKVGYLQDANASYGIIHIKNKSGREISRILHGPDANFFEIEPGAGKLYSSNTGDGSITIYDIKNNRNKLINKIQFGISIDEMAYAPEKNMLIIRSRLGGNRISLFNTQTRALKQVSNENDNKATGIGMWPTGIAYQNGYVYVLSHYAGRIDVVNPSTQNVIKRIDLRLSKKPRTDNISCMVSDPNNSRLYAAIPELGTISIVDAKNYRLVKNILIPGLDLKDVNRKSGPGKVILAANSTTGNFFAYIPSNKTLLKISGASGLITNKTTIDTSAKDRNMLYCDGKNSTLFAGNLIIDTRTLANMGSFDREGWVLGVNSLTNERYLLTARKSGLMKEQNIIEYAGTEAKRFWTIAPALSITGSVVFDFQNKVFYTGNFESSFVEKFSLSTGQNITNLSNGRGRPARR